MLRRRVLAVAVSFAMLATAAFADPFTYHNDRFGTEVTFPAEIFAHAEPPPENGDGMTWTADDGGSLAAFGSWNTENLSAQDYLDQQIGWLPEGAKVTYRRVGRTSAVVSGVEGDIVFYQRFVFAADAVHSVLLRYPAALKSIYDPLVGPIAGSLRGAH